MKATGAIARRCYATLRIESDNIGILLLAALILDCRSAAPADAPLSDGSFSDLTAPLSEEVADSLAADLTSAKYRTGIAWPSNAVRKAPKTRNRDQGPPAPVQEKGRLEPGGPCMERRQTLRQVVSWTPVATVASATGTAGSRPMSFSGRGAIPESESQAPVADSGFRREQFIAEPLTENDLSRLPLFSPGYIKYHLRFIPDVRTLITRRIDVQLNPLLRMGYDLVETGDRSVAIQIEAAGTVEVVCPLKEACVSWFDERSNSVLDPWRPRAQAAFHGSPLRPGPESGA